MYFLDVFWQKIQNKWMGRVFADDVHSTGFVVMADFQGFYIFTSSANARPIDSFCIVRPKTAKKYKMRLNFLYRFLKRNLTLDPKSKSDDSVNRALLCGNFYAVTCAERRGIREGVNKG